jgi:DNA-binding phage protein
MDKTIKFLLHNTLHTSKKSVAQLADETGMSASYLYRACNPEDESNARFPLDYLLPLMHATKNYSIIKHIANLCGFVLTVLPSPKPNRKEKNAFISEYQDKTVTATKHLIKFFDEPTEENFKTVSDSLQKVLETSINAKISIEKEYSGQMEMYL